ncbi:DUF3322 and DUF2220 domain-containing protein, partial [Bifidobacterium pseudolongum]|uniref:DUF3322 and DUF2220 domain-containing protein n=1 Tax=Bifidobacterium pseudolongum TaxID=1694 RepID=UPI0003FF06DC
MTTPADIAGAITRRVEKHLHDVQGCWPHAFPVRLGTQRELEADPVGTFDADNAVRAWAERHGCRIETVTRRVGTPVNLVACVVVPDEATALRAAGREVRARRELAVARMRMVCSRFGVDEAQAMAIVKMLSGESDVDFELFVHAAQWFATHRDLIAGMTAREVPLPGFSAKWLKASRSVRRRAICALLGWSELPLRERPGELRYRYLDEACTAWPERLATEPVQAPEMPVDTVLVVENKDTYQAMPAMPRALCVFGSGAAVSRLRTLLPWCMDGGVRVVYWGDMDADGLEILARLRATGVACASVCMDRESYDAYAQFGTTLGADGSPILRRKPKEGLCLTDEEAALYRALCTGALPNPRVEQERIPIAQALARL